MSNRNFFQELRKKRYEYTADILFNKLDDIERLYIQAYAVVYHHESGSATGYEKAIANLRKALSVF